MTLTFSAMVAPIAAGPEGFLSPEREAEGSGAVSAERLPDELAACLCEKGKLCLQFFLHP